MLKSGKLCKNNDHTCLFHCINTCLTSSCSNSFLGTRQILMHEKTCVIPIFEPVHEISNNVVYATSKASDQPAHTSLCSSLEYSMGVKLLTEHLSDRHNSTLCLLGNLQAFLSSAVLFFQNDFFSEKLFQCVIPSEYRTVSFQIKTTFSDRSTL